MFEDDGPLTDFVSLEHVFVALGDADLLDGIPKENQWVFWTCFNVFVCLMLAVDMLMGRSRSVSLRDALMWSVVWIAMAMLFNAYLYIHRGRGPAVTWFTSYLLEKFLSVDNLFVFLTIFATFKTPMHHQHKV